MAEQQIIFESSNKQPRRRKINLSDREIEILVLVADGHSNKEIAKTLGITTDTVDKHNRNIVEEIKAKNMKHAVAIAVRNKVIK